MTIGQLAEVARERGLALDDSERPEAVLMAVALWAAGRTGRGARDLAFSSPHAVSPTATRPRAALTTCLQTFGEYFDHSPSGIARASLELFLAATGGLPL